jgi:phosphonate transport system ATP-binding protein
VTDGSVVRLSQVHVTYGGHPALADVTLHVDQGERVALVGPSGAGKSTLLRVCTGAVTPTQGSAEVFGRNVASAPPPELRDLRRRVATVHQHLNLVGSLRVVHNVNAGRLGSWGRARALRSLVRPLEVDAARAALEQVGIADKLLERTDRLSGGEQQRVALARALVQRAPLILADEPVSSLDPARAGEVMALLGGVVADADRTLLVSLHDFELARRTCDRVVGIRGGRVVFDLPARDVTDDAGRELYRIAVT